MPLVNPAARRGARGLSVGDSMFGIEPDAEVAIAERDVEHRASLAYVRPTVGPIRAYVERGEAVVPERLRPLVEHAYFARPLPPQVAARLAKSTGGSVALSPHATPAQRGAILKGGRAAPYP